MKRDARPLDLDGLLQIAAVVLILEALWRFFGQFPGYVVTEGLRGIAVCRVLQGGAAFLMARRLYGRRLSEIGLPTATWKRDLGAGCAVAAVLAGLALAARQALLAVRGIDLFDLLGLRGGPIGGAAFPLWEAALILGAVGPAVEDFLFWGLALPALRARWGLRGAVAVLAAFTALHWEGGWLSLVPPAVGGGLFAFLVSWRGSILASLPLHGTANLLILLVNRRALFPPG